jgi:hypothetical protein
MKVTTEEWNEATNWEANWWGNCCNTYGEEGKHFDYAPKMGITFLQSQEGPYIDAGNKSILDVGGGPVSMLLKCRNLKQGHIVDPCDYPAWTIERYKCAHITVSKCQAEEMDVTGFDEVWMYNLLQHVQNPAKIVANSLKAGKIVRVFDWLEIAGPGHPHYLVEDEMNKWFEGQGRVETIKGGKCYYGIFVGTNEPK